MIKIDTRRYLRETMNVNEEIKLNGFLKKQESSPLRKSIVSRFRGNI